MGSRAPGWYPLPSGTQERYWDGSRWTDQTRKVARPSTVVLEEAATLPPLPPQLPPQPVIPPKPAPPKVKRLLRFPRWGTLSAVLPLLLLVPISAACAGLLIGIVAMLTPVPFDILAWVWLGTSVLLLFPWPRLAIAQWYFGARSLTLHEQLLVDMAWQAVEAKSANRSERYRVRICDTAELCGPTIGGRTIVFTQLAFRTASPDQLSALLAHGIGHHLGMHAAAPALMMWLTLPIMALGRLSRVSARVIGALLRIIAELRVGGGPRRFSLLPVLLAALRIAFYWTLLAFVAVMWALAHAVRAGADGVVILAGALATPICRSHEYEADRLAAQMGFAASLRDFLGAAPSVFQGSARPGQTRWARLWGTPPLPSLRLQRLTAVP
ncbi:MAG TPA: M48 family metalloprotease [Candidatus Limnocylindrales bacterium]|nr:M48 family metalloprotease [Candidatus Limnocylindrales bacterium]